MSVKDINVVKGTVFGIVKQKSKRGLKFLKAQLEDASGETCDILWFNQMHVANQLREGEEIILSGKVKYDRGRFTFMSPSFEKAKQVESIHTGRIIPIYHESERVSSDWLRTKIKGLLYMTKFVDEYIPEDIRKEHGYCDIQTALKEVHFPTNREKLEQARNRLAFDELLFLQCTSLQRKLQYQADAQNKSASLPFTPESIKGFLETLPFTLTDGQKIALFEALKDMEKDVPMMRLLQGDVGSGKTIVATTLMYHVMMQNLQTALMVPTEVLARQHASKLAEMFARFGKKAVLLTGSVPKSQKEKIYQGVAQGTIDCVIGTHALIQEDVHFSKLGLVIIDEQHRFGVMQRKRLVEQGYPHVLHMTATPIPRTLALTIYGDQDVSVISEMPAGRKPIITRIVAPRDRKKMYEFIRSYIAKGRQAFVICPLVEESDKLEVKSATQEYELLAQDIFPELSVGLLHGKLSSSDKSQIMLDFKEKKYDILVSTSVIEVGIDIPNANIILIEGAERFGLSQLHQFRGRVGRGEHQSFCLLATTKQEQAQSVKLKAMERHTDGFELAQIDMELRGPGEVYGVRQSGIPDLKIADMADSRIVKRARSSALYLLEKDLHLDSWPKLKKFVEHRKSLAHEQTQS